MASTLTSLARELAAAKKRIVSLASRLRKAKTKAKNGKGNGNKKAAPKRKAAAPPERDPKQDIRHDLGKAQLSWHPWETLGGRTRWARYGMGLNGPNKGAMVIVLFAERDANGWRYEVYPKNDYGDLLPAKFDREMIGTRPSLAQAKRAAEEVVGL